MGKTITERKLTFVQQAMSGHMVPQYQPSSAYRQLEFLLGRIESLTSREPFTTLPKTPQSNETSIVGKRDLGVMPGQLKKWF
jgi:carboxypeptidase D